MTPLPLNTANEARWIFSDNLSLRRRCQLSRSEPDRTYDATKRQIEQTASWEGQPLRGKSGQFNFASFTTMGADWGS